MTRAELRSLMSYWLDDLQFGYFTETQCNLWLNNAQREVQKRIIRAKQNFWVKCVQTNLVVSQGEYVLPDDFKALNLLEIIISGTPPNEDKVPLTPITLNQQFLVNNQSGTPKYYDIKNNRLILWPAPISVYALRLTYTYLVADMLTDVSVPDVPLSFQELIALTATEDGFLKDGRVSELLQKKLLVYKEDLDKDAAERKLDQPRRIRTTGKYSNGTMIY